MAVRSVTSAKRSSAPNDPPVETDGFAGKRAAGDGTEIHRGQLVGERVGKPCGADRSRRLDRAPLPDQPRQPPDNVDGRQRFHPRPATPDGGQPDCHLRRDQPRRQESQQRRRVGAHDRRPAVALEQPPLAHPLVELVVVHDHCPRIDRQTTTSQSQPERQVDVLAVHEERLGEACQLVPRRTRDRQTGAGEESDFNHARRRRAQRLAGTTSPADPGEVKDPAARVDRSAPVHRHQAHPGRPRTSP